MINVDNDVMDILGKTYFVNVVRDPEGFSEHQAGYATPIDSTITIREEMQPCNKREVLLHEILHVIDIELGIGLEEEQITALSSGLFQSLSARLSEDVTRAIFNLAGNNG